MFNFKKIVKLMIMFTLILSLFPPIIKPTLATTTPQNLNTDDFILKLQHEEDTEILAAKAYIENKYARYVNENEIYEGVLNQEKTEIVFENFPDWTDIFLSIHVTYLKNGEQFDLVDFTRLQVSSENVYELPENTKEVILQKSDFSIRSGDYYLRYFEGPIIKINAAIEKLTVKVSDYYDWIDVHYIGSTHSNVVQGENDYITNFEINLYEANELEIIDVNEFYVNDYSFNQSVTFKLDLYELAIAKNGKIGGLYDNKFYTKIKDEQNNEWGSIVNYETNNHNPLNMDFTLLPEAVLNIETNSFHYEELIGDYSATLELFKTTVSDIRFTQLSLIDYEGYIRVKERYTNEVVATFPVNSTSNHFNQQFYMNLLSPGIYVIEIVIEYNGEETYKRIDSITREALKPIKGTLVTFDDENNEVMKELQMEVFNASSGESIPIAMNKKSGEFFIPQSLLKDKGKYQVIAYNKEHTIIFNDIFEGKNNKHINYMAEDLQTIHLNVPSSANNYMYFEKSNGNQLYRKMAVGNSISLLNPEETSILTTYSDYNSTYFYLNNTELHEIDYKTKWTTKTSDDFGEDASLMYKGRYVNELHFGGDLDLFTNLNEVIMIGVDVLGQYAFDFDSKFLLNDEIDELYKGTTILAELDWNGSYIYSEINFPNVENLFLYEQPTIHYQLTNEAKEVFHLNLTGIPALEHTTIPNGTYQIDLVESEFVSERFNVSLLNTKLTIKQNGPRGSIGDVITYNTDQFTRLSDEQLVTFKIIDPTNNKLVRTYSTYGSSSSKKLYAEEIYNSIEVNKQYKTLTIIEDLSNLYVIGSEVSGIELSDGFVLNLIDENINEIVIDQAFKNRGYELYLKAGDDFLGDYAANYLKSISFKGTESLMVQIIKNSELGYQIYPIQTFTSSRVLNLPNDSDLFPVKFKADGKFLDVYDVQDHYLEDGIVSMGERTNTLYVSEDGILGNVLALIQYEEYDAPILYSIDTRDMVFERNKVFNLDFKPETSEIVSIGRYTNSKMVDQLDYNFSLKLGGNASTKIRSIMPLAINTSYPVWDNDVNIIPIEDPNISIRYMSARYLLSDVANELYVTNGRSELNVKHTRRLLNRELEIQDATHKIQNYDFSIPKKTPTGTYQLKYDIQYAHDKWHTVTYEFVVGNEKNPAPESDVFDADYIERELQKGKVEIVSDKKLTTVAAEFTFTEDATELLATAKQSVTVQVDGVTIIVPAELFTQAKGKPFTLHVSKDQLNISPVGSTPRSSIYSFETKIGNEIISAFNAPIGISIPLESTPINENKTGVYNILSNNERAYMISKVENDKITFKTRHFSDFTVLEYNKTFTDVKANWSKEPIDTLASLNVVSGSTATKFNPDGDITRGQFAVLVARLLNLPASSAKNTFSDVAPGKYYAASIEAAAAAKIIEGNNGKFNPDGKITRQAMAVIIINAINYKDSAILAGAPRTPVTFADAATVSPFAKESVTLAAQLNIIAGSKNKKGGYDFNPKGNATRASASKMLYEVLNLLK